MPRAYECVRLYVCVCTRTGWTHSSSSMNAGQPHADDRYTDAASATHPSSKNAKSSTNFFSATFIFTATGPLGDALPEWSVCSVGVGAARWAAGCSFGIKATWESLDLSCWQQAQGLTGTQLRPGRLNWIKSLCMMTSSNTAENYVFTRNIILWISKEIQRIQKHINKGFFVAISRWRKVS